MSNTVIGEHRSNVSIGKRELGSFPVQLFTRCRNCSARPVVRRCHRWSRNWPQCDIPRNVRRPRRTTAPATCAGGKSEAYDAVVYNHDPPTTHSSSGWSGGRSSTRTGVRVDEFPALTGAADFCRRHPLRRSGCGRHCRRSRSRKRRRSASLGRRVQEWAAIGRNMRPWPSRLAWHG